MNVIEIGPLAYGNPQAKISYTTFVHRIKEGELPARLLEAATDLIQSRSCMIDVTVPGDGCIDGRNDHERLKVAGGGYLTGTAMLLGVEPALETSDAEVARAAELLSTQHILCGAHTGEHESDEATDCGANDKFELILAAGLEYKKEISANVEAISTIVNYDYQQSKFDAVLDGWKATLEKTGFFVKNNGQTRLAEIKKALQKVDEAEGEGTSEGVVRRLSGDHKEAFIIANLAEDQTFSQVQFKEKLQGLFAQVLPQELPQTFVVDIPRVIEIADALARETGEDADTLFYAGLGYQFATAATLTDGTLHTFIVE